MEGLNIVGVQFRRAGRIYDFLAGETRYKGNLGKPGPDFVYLLIQRPTAMTRAEAALRRGWEGVKAFRAGRKAPSQTVSGGHGGYYIEA